MAWKDVTPWQNKLVNTIIQSPAHIITTMRVKTHHDVVDVGGKKRPVKIGLAPIQKEGLEYEFTCVLSLDKDSYLYTSSKDRTGIFEGKHEKLSIDTGKRIMDWLESGKPLDVIEQEEIARFNEHLLSCTTLETLRNLYSFAKAQYPSHADTFLKIAEDRSKLLKADGGMVS